MLFSTIYYGLLLDIDYYRLLSIKSVWFDYFQLLTRLLSIVIDPNVTYSLSHKNTKVVMVL
jgi:hypothetical protein